MAQTFLFGLLLIIIVAFASAKSVQREQGFGIQGGELANITELPHQVFIKHKVDGLWIGGSIISSQHILTSAKSFDDPIDYYTVMAATDYSKNGGEEYTIAEVIKNPDPKIAIVVIKLAKEIKFSDKAKPIALAGPKYRIKDGAELIASGWGLTEDIKKSDKLRKVTISKLSDDKCKQEFHDRYDLSKEFCAGGGGKQACLHDEGGPLITKTRKGNVLVGVNDDNFCLGKQNKPSVFIYVSQFNKWIKGIVNKDLQLLNENM